MHVGKYSSNIIWIYCLFGVSLISLIKVSLTPYALVPALLLYDKKT